jgi:hypothetical protein
VPNHRDSHDVPVSPSKASLALPSPWFSLPSGSNPDAPVISIGPVGGSLVGASDVVVGGGVVAVVGLGLAGAEVTGPAAGRVPSCWPIFMTFWTPMTRATSTRAPTMARAIRDCVPDGASGTACPSIGTGGSSPASPCSSASASGTSSPSNPW